MMKLTKKGTVLHFINRDTGLSNFCWCFTLFLFIWGAYLILIKHENFGFERVQGSTGAAITMALIAFIFREEGSFEFDQKVRHIRWSRKKFFRTKSGIIRFSDVMQIIIQTAMMTRNESPTRRIVLVIKTGEVPLTVSYRSDSGSYDDMANTIRTFINLQDQSLKNAPVITKKMVLSQLIRLLKARNDSLLETKRAED